MSGEEQSHRDAVQLAGEGRGEERDILKLSLLVHHSYLFHSLQNQTSSASYWPSRVGDTEQYGGYEITFNSEEKIDVNLQVRKLTVSGKSVSVLTLLCTVHVYV